MYNLYVIINSEILLVSLLNIDGLATSIFDPVLGFGATVIFSPLCSAYTTTNAYNIAICFYCYLIEVKVDIVLTYIVVNGREINWYR